MSQTNEHEKGERLAQIQRLLEVEMERRWRCGQVQEMMEIGGNVEEEKLSAKGLHLVAAGHLLNGNKNGFRETIRSINRRGVYCKSTALLIARCGKEKISKTFEEIGEGLWEAIELETELKNRLKSKEIDMVIEDIEVCYERGKDIPMWPDSKEATEEILVVCWDSSINAMGRAAVLCEICVESKREVRLLGLSNNWKIPAVWKPLLEERRGYCIEVMGYKDIHELVEKGLAYARKNYFGTVWVSKTRPSSLIVGFIYKLVWGSRVITDIDDYEAAFGGVEIELEDWSKIARDSIGSQSLEKLQDEPLTSIQWSLFAERMLNAFDGISTSSEKINSAYGGAGLVVRHLRRMETDGNADTERIRKGEEKVIRVLFNGTIREHKGLNRLCDLIIAEKNRGLEIELYIYQQHGCKELASKVRKAGIRVVTLKDVKYSENIGICRNVDVIITLQKEDSFVSKYQTPAKISDACLAGTLVIATETDPIRELKEEGLEIEIVEGGKIGIHEALGKRWNRRRVTDARRLLGIEERSGEIMEKLTKVKVVPTGENNWFKQIMKELSIILARDLSRLVENEWEDVAKKSDVIFLWRQHDTGKYPRRQHAIARRLSEREEIGHLVHLEPAIDMKSVKGTEDEALIMRRYRGIDATRKLSYHTYVYEDTSTNKKTSGYMPMSWQAEFVEKRLCSRSVGNKRILWIYPPIRDIGMFITKLDYDIMVVDYVDNILTESGLKDEEREYIQDQYRYLAAGSDLQIVNCTAMQSSVVEWGGQKTILVENAFPSRSYKKWRFGGKVKRCIYTGNMNGRLNWALLKSVAKVCPEIRFELYGESKVDVEWMFSDNPNVVYGGVVEPAQLQTQFSDDCIALIPHLENEKTRHMNLIKYYEYRRMGVPVITTCRWNIPRIPHIYYARDTKEVVSCIREIEKEGKKDPGCFEPSEEVIQENSWDWRMSTICEEIKKLREE